jgi:lysophospholipase L1-like esterase
MADQDPVVVCFGDSLTEGGRSYPDFLSRRLGLKVWNAGIAGNRLLQHGFGASGLTRFEDDVLAVPGVTHVVVQLGVNDLGMTPAPTADQLIAGLTTLARAARAAGVKALGATLPPTGGTSYQGFDTPDLDRARQAVNSWLRGTHEFTAVVDVHQALHDPAHPARCRPEFDSGDHLHPNAAGAEAIARSIDLEVFT